MQRYCVRCYLDPCHNLYKSKSIIIKNRKDVGMTVPKSIETKYACIYAGKSSDDGIRNKEQHEGKDKECECNNHYTRNPGP